MGKGAGLCCQLCRENGASVFNVEVDRLRMQADCMSMLLVRAMGCEPLGWMHGEF
jgi:hypothetical protein